MSLTTRVALAIALATSIVFAGSLSGGFVWDDHDIIVANPWFRGLDLPHLRWMATSLLSNQWVPLMWLTFGLDYFVWGLNPAGYHATNVVLHAATAAVFYVIALRLLTYAVPRASARRLQMGAAFAALFFAIHPLRAESVAWVSARRDVLSGFLFVLSVATYLEAIAASRRRRWWLTGSIACYAGALLAKPIVVPLPLLLVVLDVYPLRRLTLWPPAWPSAGQRAVWLEKVPYVALSAGATVVALATVARAGVAQPGLGARIASLAYSVSFYVEKTFLPVSLSPLYPLPSRLELGDVGVLARAAAVVALTGVLVALRKRWPGLLAAWIAYLAMVVAPSVRAQGGPQLVADRYSYLACLPLALLLGGIVTGIGSGVAVGRGLRRVVTGGLATLLVAFAGLTWWQVGLWHDSERLWRWATESDPECVVCRGQLGRALDERGRYREAIEEYRRGLALRPRDGALTINLSYTLLTLNLAREALEVLRPAIADHPHDILLQSRLVWALTLSGSRKEADVEANRLIAMAPSDGEALLTLGFALVSLDRPREAIPYLQRAAAEPLPLPAAHYWLARAYSALGDEAKAAAETERFHVLDRGVRAQLEQMGRR